MESLKFPKRPTLRWDGYKRQALCCLYRFFVCGKKEIEEIFSYMFRGHLNERGIRGFVPFATLNTQWVWMKNKQDPIWTHVHINTAFETDGEWKEIITKIKCAARTLRFELREKTEDDIDISCWKDLGSDGERSIVSNEAAAPMLTHSLSTPKSLNPIVLLPSSQDHVFSGRSRASQSIDQTMDQRVDRIIDQQNNIHNDIPNGLYESTESVATSYGKLCLWCEHEGTTYEFEDMQELENEDNHYDSECENHGHCHQHDERQDDPGMREYTRGFKQFMRGLHGEIPYSDEELFDSESEYLMIPQESLTKVHPFCDPNLSLSSGLEQDPLACKDNSDCCADRGSPADLVDLGTPSISMEDQSGALDDDHIPTQETLFNFSFPKPHAGPDEALDNDFGGQRASRYKGPSDDEMRMEPLRQISVEVLNQVESQSIHLSYQEMDVLMYDGKTWKQV
ncbi:unnamed protein product [Penicillium glandicola]